MERQEPQHNDQLLALAAAVNSKVEAALQDDLLRTLSGCDAFLDKIIRYAVFSGGKRIRPFLTVLSSRLCGRDDDKLYRLAAAFEYLHVASLVHDDIIDNAQQRRGRPTLSAEFGPTAAILAGDWLLSRSMHLVAKLSGHEGLDVFCKATEGMVDGEFLQLRWAEEPSVTEEDYFTVIRRKTGNLIASACEIGGIYAGIDSTGREALAAFGYNIGAAFQVVDDLLDYLGDPRLTGKKTGNDFLEGKITLPLIRALATAAPNDQSHIRGLIQGDRTATGTYDEVTRFIQQHDGFASARQTAEDFVDKANSSLKVFDSAQDQQSMDALRSLARYILERKK